MARAFAVNVSEMAHELRARRTLLESEIAFLRTRLRALPPDTRERPFLIQQITATSAVADELASLTSLILGKESE